ncbi:MAG: GNAT family N-acetyltransferase [Alphaproteobacteria bacterium]
MDTTADLSKTILRPSAIEDVAAITAIYAHEVREGRGTFELEPPDEAEMAARREKLVAAGFPYIVASVDDAVAGYAYAGPYRPRPAYAGTLENSVYVHRGFQRRGIARLLMRRLIDEAEAGGFRQMVAVIGDSANRPSIALHEALGFRHAGMLRSVGWKHGLWLDTVLMQRTLGDGDTTPR